MTIKSNLTTLVRAHIGHLANPNRSNCPTLWQLKEFLRGQTHRDLAEKLYSHLPQCRECLLELEVLRDIDRDQLIEN